MTMPEREAQITRGRGQRLAYTIMPSPLGDLLLMGDGERLSGLYMSKARWGKEIGDDWIQDKSPFYTPVRQLAAYFAGELKTFDLPLDLQGTPFQLTVWQALQEIPYGHTISYGELATRVGNPKASRAVGMANGKNPVSIIVPCHRVIGASGSLTGYGGGLERKRWLLDLEDRVHIVR